MREITQAERQPDEIRSRLAIVADQLRALAQADCDAETLRGAILGTALLVDNLMDLV
jgi:hypothetical protein